LRLVAVAVPVPFLDLLTYNVPDSLALPPIGARVRVPVGTRTLTGCVVRHDALVEAGTDVRDIAEALDREPLLPESIVELCRWVADYFAQFTTHWDKKSVLIWVAGDYGFDQGIDSATDTPRNGGPVQRYTVKGILIYKRQPSGEFKVYRDIWNFNSPPTRNNT